MQSLNDDERREVLGEVLVDELRAIREYVQHIPDILKQLKDHNSRLHAVENIVQLHEIDIRYLRSRLV